MENSPFLISKEMKVKQKMKPLLVLFFIREPQEMLRVLTGGRPKYLPRGRGQRRTE